MYCRRELGRLADRASEFEEQSVRILAVSTAPREKLQGLQDSLGAGVTLLSDTEAVATGPYGMLDPEPFPSMGQARSGSFLIDAAGRLRQSWLLRHYHERPDPDEILEARKIAQVIVVPGAATTTGCGSFRVPA